MSIELLLKKIGIPWTEFNVEMGTRPVPGYFCNSLDYLEASGVVEAYWSKAHDLDLRLFIGNEIIRGLSREISYDDLDDMDDLNGEPEPTALFAIPKLDTLDVLKLSTLGADYCDEKTLRTHLKYMYENWPFEISEVDEIDLHARLVSPLKKSQARILEQAIMNIAPWSGDPDDSNVLRGMIRDQHMFKMTFRTL